MTAEREAVTSGFAERRVETGHLVEQDFDAVGELGRIGNEGQVAKRHVKVTLTISQSSSPIVETKAIDRITPWQLNPATVVFGNLGRLQLGTKTTVTIEIEDRGTKPPFRASRTARRCGRSGPRGRRSGDDLLRTRADTAAWRPVSRLYPAPQQQAAGGVDRARRRQLRLLGHPYAVGVAGDPGHADATRLKLEKEEVLDAATSQPQSPNR